MLDLIKQFFVNGWTTLKGVLLLGLGVVFNFNFFHCALPTYFVACAFFKTEPLLKVLNRFGFTPTEL